MDGGLRVGHTIGDGGRSQSGGGGVATGEWGGGGVNGQSEVNGDQRNDSRLKPGY